MSTLAEIEAAVATLQPAEIEHLENVLRELRSRTSEQQRLQELYQRTGFHPFPKSGGEPVTIEAVRQLCEDEGV